MSITNVEERTQTYHVITTDESHPREYIRYGPESWFACYGSTREAIYLRKKERLEKAFQARERETEDKPENAIGRVQVRLDLDDKSRRYQAWLLEYEQESYVEEVPTESQFVSRERTEHHTITLDVAGLVIRE